MRVMNLKLIRDLWRQRLQCLAIVMIVACGVAGQITSFGLIATLNSGMDHYYSQSKFPDLFVKVNALPLSQCSQIHEISGVSAVQPRIVVDAPLSLVAEPDDPATATLIAVPAEYEGGINRVIVRKGKPLRDLARHEVLVSEVFAEARGIGIGDLFKATIQGRQAEWTVAGIAIGPEYLFQIRDGAGVPDNRRFAVIWMRYEDLSMASNLAGLFNEFVLTMSNDTSIHLVKDRIETILQKSTILSMQGRDMQVSHRYTTNAIAQLYSVAIVPPAIFLAVASFLIYIATSRLIKTERENIAMQRAFGYSAWDVGQHYFSFVMVVVLAGCMTGVVGGIVLANTATETYREIYRFPSLTLIVSPSAIVFSIVISCVAGFIGGSYSVLEVSRMPPAVGLRPEPPASYRLAWYDHLASVLGLSPITKMVLRGLGRWPLRTGLGILGVGLGIGVMILGSYTQGAVGYVIDFEFFLTRRYDVMVQFCPGTSARATDEIRQLPGVLYCEPFESGRCVIRAGNRERTVTVLGIAKESKLMCPVGDNLRQVQIDGHGIALSQKLVEALCVELGSNVEMILLDGRNKSMLVRAESIVTDYAGLNAYVDFTDFQRWFRSGESASGGLLQVDGKTMSTITKALYRLPRVQAVTIKSAALENFKENDSKNLLLFRVFNMLFSSVIGIGAVYSVASISLVERQRDLALLRVLGYSASETGRVLIGELMVMSAIAVPVGCLSGYGFAAVATWMLNSETQRIPLRIQPEAYLSSVVVSLISCAISACIIQRRVNHLDCVAQLKSKD